MIEMVVDGQPRARIVVSKSASPVEQHAAAELNKYIYQMSGAQLPVETTPSDDKANIYIGRATRPKNSIYQKRPWASTHGQDNWARHRFGRDKALLMPLCDLPSSDEASRLRFL